jgi:hypothetical protein
MMIKTQPDDALPLASDDLLGLPHSEAVTLALLRILAPVLELEPHLRDNDFERIPSLRDFIAISRTVIHELGFGED